MSKQKSTKTETQRFSGPELSELLDQVARTHGADAAIQAVNKIRSGGVAGFFCREEFEVVVQVRAYSKAKKTGQKAEKIPSKSNPGTRSDIAPSSGTAGGALADPDAGATTKRRSDIAPATASHAATPAAAAAAAATTQPAPQPGAQLSRDLVPTPTSAPAAAHRDGELRTEQAPIEPAPETHDVFAGPRPVDASVTKDRFRALLEQRLDDASEAEFDFSEHLGSPTERAITPPRRANPAPTPEPEPNLQPIVPAPGLPISQQTVSGAVGVMAPAALQARSNRASDFWFRLQQVQHELASFMPLASATVATIGPLSLTTPIARRLRAEPPLESADVIVLTARAEIVSEPTWELVRSGHQLVDAVLDQGRRPTLILIDVPVELPNWVAPLENRLRIAGVGLFRYAVPGNPTAEQLDDYRLGSDVPYVVDLISRVRPESLVEFIERRHPIASVSGADLNAELLLAMREQVNVGT